MRGWEFSYRWLGCCELQEAEAQNPGRATSPLNQNERTVRTGRRIIGVAASVPDRCRLAPPGPCPQSDAVRWPPRTRALPSLAGIAASWCPTPRRSPPVGTPRQRWARPRVRAREVGGGGMPDRGRGQVTVRRRVLRGPRYYAKTGKYTAPSTWARARRVTTRSFLRCFRPGEDMGRTGEEDGGLDEGGREEAAKLRSPRPGGFPGGKPAPHPHLAIDWEPQLLMARHKDLVSASGVLRRKRGGSAVETRRFQALSL